jgi:hypothetical protein
MASVGVPLSEMLPERTFDDTKRRQQWRQVNAGEMGTFSHFLVQGSVLPAPPFNKIKGLHGLLATLTTLIGDSDEQQIEAMNPQRSSPHRFALP